MKLKLLCYLISLLTINVYGQMKTTKLQEMNSLTCKLTTPELQQRKKTVIADLKKLVLEKTETASGMKYKFEGTDTMIDLLTTFIKTERLCCDFFVFNLTITDENSYVWLELGGPAGTKEFIEAEIGF